MTLRITLRIVILRIIPLKIMTLRIMRISIMPVTPATLGKIQLLPNSTQQNVKSMIWQVDETPERPNNAEA